MTAALRELHWLPIAQRIEFKVLTLMHGAVHNNTPRYLFDRISTYAPPRTLRSGTQSLAAVPRINLERYGRRAFQGAGPSLWNALPLGLRTQKDPDLSRRDLKTHLFNVFFEVIIIIYTCRPTLSNIFATRMWFTDTFYCFKVFILCLVM